MKVLQVIDLFSPMHGGAAKVASQISAALASHRHDILVYTSDLGLSQQYISSISGVRVQPFKSWLNLAEFRVTPGIIRQAREQIRHFDVIHLHNYRTFQNMVVCHYARKHGIPYVLQAHGSLTTFSQKRGLKRTFDTVWGYGILRDASKVIAITKIEAEEYRSMGVSPEKIEIVPNGVDLSEFEDLPAKGEYREKRGLRNDDKVILYIGRIHQTKGLDILARAFADLSQVLRNVRLVVAGPDDGYLPSLRKLVIDLGISDKVVFDGLFAGRDKLRAYVDADVHVSFREREPFGLTLIEACACGTPVICSTGCGIADAIDGQVGLAVPYDKGQLQQAMQHILSDDKLRLQFGERGKALVRERFNWERIVGHLEALYEGVRRK